MAWSTVGALGATLGGAICSTFGNRVGFVTDACSFVVVAAITSTLPKDYEKLKKKVTDNSAESRNSSGSHLQMLADAFRYLRSDPKVLVTCCAKACGSLIWSAADLLQVRFSSMDSMGSLGGQQLTLGILYSMVGVGCYIGPITWNGCTPQDGKMLFSRIVSAFANFSIAYLVTIFAPNIFVLMLATVTRAFGAGMLWTYSTLLIQIWSPDEYKGRLFAFESFLFCLVSIFSFFLCALLFDYWELDEREISTIMCILASSVLVLWVTSFFVLFKQTDSGKSVTEIDGVELRPVTVELSDATAAGASAPSAAYSTLPAAEEDIEYADCDDDEVAVRRDIQRSTSV